MLNVSIATVKTFVEAVSTLETLMKFVNSGLLSNTLSTIGDVNLGAAYQELSDLRQSKNKRETVNRAATQLRIAYQAYKGMKPNVFQVMNFRNVMRASLQFRNTGIALTICYLYLGEWSYATKILNEMQIYDYIMSERMSPLSNLVGGLSFGIYYLSDFNALFSGETFRPELDKYYDYFTEFDEQARKIIKSNNH